MAKVNVDVVLHGNPVKNLIIARNKMKSDYTQESAREYLESYVGMPVSMVLENSRMIFSEPYYGYDFYKNIITEASCIFPHYEEELYKVSSFISESADAMGKQQLSMYQELETLLENKCEEYKNSSLVFEYAKDHGYSTESMTDLADLIYESVNFAKYEDTDRNDQIVKAIGENINAVESSAAYALLSPYVYEAVSGIASFENADTFMNPVFEDTDSWCNGLEAMMITKKLSCDTPYRLAVKSMADTSERSVFESYMESNVEDAYDALITAELKGEDLPPVYEDGSRAIDALFENDLYFEEVSEKLEPDKVLIESVTNHMADVINSMMNIEYENADDGEAIEGYDFFSEGTTVDECMKFFMESEVPVVPNEKQKSSKPRDPRKDEDFTVRVQNKAMDIEAKQTKQLAEAKRKQTNLRNAVKAVTNIPKNVVDGIKGTLKGWERADDKRRKDYMVKPGFRKSIFKKLKLALTYGALAHVKLLFVPAFAIIRHFSKEKDARIKNELMREIQVEIDVCNEKINDANSNNDQKQKYELMRIKSQLEAELVRVKVNSKYV